MDIYFQCEVGDCFAGWYWMENVFLNEVTSLRNCFYSDRVHSGVYNLCNPNKAITCLFSVRQHLRESLSGPSRASFNRAIVATTLSKLAIRPHSKSAARAGVKDHCVENRMETCRNKNSAANITRLTDSCFRKKRDLVDIEKNCLAFPRAPVLMCRRVADAKFWVGRGPKPSPQGIRVPDENGKEVPLRRYDRKTVVLTLPGDLTVFDIGHFGIWCEAFTVDFGHVQIPPNLNVPPSLKMLGVSPQVG
jgi:hypothetical protein